MLPPPLPSHSLRVPCPLGRSAAWRRHLPRGGGSLACLRSGTARRRSSASSSQVRLTRNHCAATLPHCHVPHRSPNGWQIWCSRSPRTLPKMLAQLQVMPPRRKSREQGCRRGWLHWPPWSAWQQLVPSRPELWRSHEPPAPAAVEVPFPAAVVLGAMCYWVALGLR